MSWAKAARIPLFEKVALVLFLVAAPVAAQESPAAPPPLGEAAPRQIFPIGRAAEPIRVDGHVDEVAWGTATRFEMTIEIDPGENIPAPVRGVCKVLYDDRFFYVSFVLEDPEPEAIRAHLSDRDQSFRDDFVGFMVDTFNDERRGFEFFVNPLGVQMDGSRNDVGSGNNEDMTWDAIWDAAGRITSTGWEAEMAIPFTQLRFPRTDGEQTWSFYPFRSYPRTVRHQIGAAPLERNNNCFFCQAPKIKGFAGATPGRNIEVAPTLTAHRTDVREDFPDGDMAKDEQKVDLGLSARWGITPNMAINLAANPDFSQVEADSAQLSVNNRFALFYPEKRPFFLEGADFFQTGLNIVYTRNVADPDWGVKLTGKEGKTAIGGFVARDAVTNLLLPSNAGSSLAELDRATTDAVFRWRRDVGESSTVGLLYTDRNGGDYSNRVLGADGLWKITPTDSVRVQWLATQTRYPDEFADENGLLHGTFDDDAYSLVYSHDTKTWSGWIYHEDIGKEFRADLGFIPRVDTRDSGMGGGYTWWGEKSDWWTRINLNVEATRVEDHSGLLTDEVLYLGGQLNGAYQSTLQANIARRKEYYNGVTYEHDRQNVFFNIRPTGDFTCSVGGNFGDYVDYVNATAENPRSGQRTSIWPGLTWNVGEHLYLQVDETWEKLDLPEGELYRANLTQAKLMWQFNVRTFVRAIVQYVDVERDPSLYGGADGDPSTDPYPERDRNLFTQLLFSWKMNPQTMVFLGYSDSRTGWDDASNAEHPVVGMTQADRTVFLKIGYAWLQ